MWIVRRLPSRGSRLERFQGRGHGGRSWFVKEYDARNRVDVALDAHATTASESVMTTKGNRLRCTTRGRGRLREWREWVKSTSLHAGSVPSLPQAGATINDLGATAGSFALRGKIKSKENFDSRKFAVPRLSQTSGTLRSAGQVFAGDPGPLRPPVDVSPGKRYQ